jgi:hypothetical protein
VVFDVDRFQERWSERHRAEMASVDDSALSSLRARLIVSIGRCTRLSGRERARGGGGVPGVRRNRRYVLTDVQSFDEQFPQPGSELSGEKGGRKRGARGVFKESQDLARGLGFRGRGDQRLGWQPCSGRALPRGRRRT